MRVVSGAVIQVPLLLIFRCVCVCAWCVRAHKRFGIRGPPLGTQSPQQWSTSPCVPIAPYPATLHLFMQLPRVLSHSVSHNCIQT